MTVTSEPVDLSDSVGLVITCESCPDGRQWTPSPFSERMQTSSDKDRGPHGLVKTQNITMSQKNKPNI